MALPKTYLVKLLISRGVGDFAAFNVACRRSKAERSTIKKSLDLMMHLCLEKGTNLGTRSNCALGSMAAQRPFRTLKP